MIIITAIITYMAFIRMLNAGIAQRKTRFKQVTLYYMYMYLIRVIIGEIHVLMFNAK